MKVPFRISASATQAFIFYRETWIWNSYNLKNEARTAGAELFSARAALPVSASRRDASPESRAGAPFVVAAPFSFPFSAPSNNETPARSLEMSRLLWGALSGTRNRLGFTPPPHDKKDHTRGNAARSQREGVRDTAEGQCGRTVYWLHYVQPVIWVQEK